MIRNAEVRARSRLLGAARRMGLTFGTLGCLMLLAAEARAQEIAPGTLLTEQNIDALQDMTLGGHRLADLITPSQDTMIREYGFEMILKPPREITIDPRLPKVTEMFRGQARLDDKKILRDYVSGVPFPDIDPADPDSGYKLAYNILRFGWVGHTIDLDPMYFLVIDGEDGLQREMGWRYKRYLTSGRVTEPYIEDPDDPVIKYESLINLYPQDTRGLGILTVNYDDARLPDVYAYVKSIRRVRRLSSSSWADPVSATDFLTDETFGMNLDPTWYKDWKIREKTYVLGTVNGEIRGLNLDESDPAKRFPAMIFDKPPHWNYREVFEPVEVFVMDAYPPDNHLVSKHTFYVATNPYAPMMVWILAYDQQGDPWRVRHVAYGPDEWADTGEPARGITIVGVFDIKRLHATVLYRSEAGWHWNIPGADVADFSPESLSRQLR